MVAGIADGLPGTCQVPGEQLDPGQDAAGLALRHRAADRVGDLDGLPGVSGALFRRPQDAVRLPQAGKGYGFRVAVADLAGDGQRLLVQLESPGDLAELEVAVAETAQDARLAPPIADLPGDGQRLLVQLDCPGGLAEVGEAGGETVQGISLALPVADLPGDDQRLLKELDCPGDLAELEVAVAETAQVGDFALPVAALPVDIQRLLEGARSPR